MIKVGIMTFHASNNCGSMLQAYALQQILKYYSIESEIIDFSSIEQQRMYSIFYIPRKIKDIFRNILNAIFYRQISQHSKDFQSFSDKFLLKSYQSYSTLKDLKEEQFDYDVYITGSDQVWNINAEDFNDAYFLPFVIEKKKIAYAVSLGATNLSLSEEKEKYAKYIKSFDKISVRERNAQKWIESFGNREIDICADPTLLLSADEWNSVVGQREIKGKYIFWYTMIYSNEISNILAKISKKYNMPVYVMDAKEWSRRALYLKGIHLAKSGGPKSYLSLVKNADIVITSSFHGTVFCNIFKKNFWYINIHDKNTNDDRASYLLEQLNLSDRYIKKKDILNQNLLKMPSYIHQEKMQDIIDYSKQFLENAIIGEYDYEYKDIENK